MRAADEFKRGSASPHLVRVYEKIHQGVWSYNGTFNLIDAWSENDGHREVFKFKLQATEDEIPSGTLTNVDNRRRLIPTPAKVQVWERDKGR